ncbi:hypothetical protein BGZ51_001721 [Haplosporangium sp. Z 767]|nr:hypothetical protein BGZ51_001721 [Haplosporangium sp. Z 767]
MRRRNVNSSPFASRAVAPKQRNHNVDSLSSSGTILLQNNEALSESRCQNLHDVSKPSIQHPYEIIALIIQHLPASDLFAVLGVNRLWRQIALLETKQVDLSECFPLDCLGLEDEEYSDFDFVYNLFSIFPLVSSLVIKDRYMRDRDLRVVTAGILAGKMAFTKATEPAVGSDLYLEAQHAIAERRHRQRSIDGNTKDGSSVEDKENHPIAHTKPVTKVMRGTINEDLREFSRSVGTYVLIPQTRNTLRKKILERLQHNLEQKEIQDYCWMIENGIDHTTFASSFAPSFSSSYVASSPLTKNSDTKQHTLVPMTHYRFQDCCFANDWGAVMDVNKLPMIGLAAAISGQGLVVDLEGSYGAPSKSIRTMLGFCFGAHCVISLAFNFRHTHMELEHVTELLSENPILYQLDIVDSPAYHDLIRLPALRGLDGILERMHEACLDLDEKGLEDSLQSARLVLKELEKDIACEEAEQEEKGLREKSDHKRAPQGPLETLASESSVQSFITQPPPMNDRKRPIESLSQQLSFPAKALLKDKLRTAKVLLMGVIQHNIMGLINTRDRQTGQSLLHTLAWRRSYSSLAILAMNSSLTGSSELPTPPSHDQEQQTEPSIIPSLSSSFPPMGYLTNQGSGIFSSSLSSSSTQDLDRSTTMGLLNEGSETRDLPASSSTLSSLISISSLPAALSSALSFRRMSLPVSTLWIPEDSEDIGVGEGILPEPDSDEEDEGQQLQGDRPEIPNSDEYYEPLSSSPLSSPSPPPLLPLAPPVVVIPEQHPVAISLRMAKSLLKLKANPNVYNKDGRSAVVCASYMGFQPMEALLAEHGGYSKELIRIRETM